MIYHDPLKYQHNVDLPSSYSSIFLTYINFDTKNSLYLTSNLNLLERRLPKVNLKKI